MLASILGLLVGLGAAKGINELFKSFGADLPQEGLVFKARTVIVGLLVGTIVTLVASLAPARRATRVPPLAAMREEAAPAQPPTRRRKILSWALLVLGAIGILFALFGGAPAGQALSILGLGAVALFIAVALLSPRLVPPIANAVGYPLERVRGVAGRLARENAMRNPSRTAVTAAALMIGLALVTFVSILAAGVKASIDDTVQNRQKAELVVLNNDGQFTPISPESATAIRRVPGVGVVSPLNSSQAEIERRQRQAVRERDRPARRSTGYGTCEIDEGPPNLPATLTPRDIALKKDFADSNSLDVGDTLQRDDADRQEAQPAGDRDIRGQGRARGRLHRDRDRSSRSSSASATTTSSSSTVQPGANVDAVQARVDRVLEQRFPVAEVQNKGEFKDTITGGVDQFLALIYALLSLSVIVSLFGIVNTLVLSIHERTRELGMMRAIGTSRRLVRRIVRYESVITALIGAVLGLVVGFILGVVTTVALEDEGFLLSIPVASLIVFAILAVLAGVLAAIPPARRASRLNVLEALAYE